MRRVAGFTLLEMMVSLSLISIAIIGLLRVVMGNLNAVGDARDRTEAATLAQAKIVEIERDPTVLQGDSQGNFGEQHPRFSWSSEVLETQWPELKQLAITVSWLRGSKQKQLRVESVVRLPDETSTEGAAATTGTAPVTPGTPAEGAR